MDEIEGKPEQNVLQSLAVRAMAKAKYTTEAKGHFGLAFDHYTHFTSPIRRYPDMMVHRLLQHYLDGGKSVSKSDFESKCIHSSEREKRAADAERASIKYKQVEFMQQYLGEEFEGIISGVASFGFFVETVLHKCEGMVTVRDLSEHDDFRLDEADYALVGLRTKRKFRMGDKVMIKVVAANLSKRQLDYQWVPTVSKASKTTAKETVKAPAKAPAKKK